MKNPKMTPSKPVGTGNTRLPFDQNAGISPTPEAKSKNSPIQGDLFNKDALSSEMPTNGKYAAGAKKGYVNKSVFDHKMPNTIDATSDY